jgi:hypothetical protein
MSSRRCGHQNPDPLRSVRCALAEGHAGPHAADHPNDDYRRAVWENRRHP